MYMPLLEWSVNISEIVIDQFEKLSQSGHGMIQLGFWASAARNNVVEDCMRVGRVLGLPEEKPRVAKPVDPGSIIW